jgi:hypothetical protein
MIKYQLYRGICFDVQCFVRCSQTLKNTIYIYIFFKKIVQILLNKEHIGI